MSFIQNNLNKSEKLSHFEKPSAKPIFVFSGLSLLGILFVIYEKIVSAPKIDLSNPNYTDYSFYGYCVFFVCLWFALSSYIERFINEYGISNTRVISKSGFISRNIGEMNLKSIESVNVKQSILGRLLNYGNIIIAGRGNTTITFKDVDNPVEIRKSIQNKS